MTHYVFDLRDVWVGYSPSTGSAGNPDPRFIELVKMLHEREDRVTVWGGKFDTKYAQDIKNKFLVATGQRVYETMRFTHRLTTSFHYLISSHAIAFRGFGDYP